MKVSCSSSGDIHGYGSPATDPYLNFFFKKDPLWVLGIISRGPRRIEKDVNAGLRTLPALHKEGLLEIVKITQEKCSACN